MPLKILDLAKDSTRHRSDRHWPRRKLEPLLLDFDFLEAVEVDERRAHS